jgi:hypothetical protein
MRQNPFVFIGILALLLILAGCTKAECRKDTDCVKPHFTGACVDKKCSWNPVPNECGNSVCDGKENECTCPQDCGSCTGKLGKYLVKQCNAQNDCTADIPAATQKPITLTRELQAGGSKISSTTTFNQPFNLKRDQLELDFGINTLATGTSDLKITRLAVTGMTSDRRTVQLADQSISLPLSQGAKAKTYVILDFPTADTDGELTNLQLTVYLDYVLTSGTSSSPKSITINQQYQSLKFVWARPEKPSGCGNCDDGNAATEDVCGPETNYYCAHQPKSGVCGSGVCDGGKNKCTCPQDCGSCSGGGTYTTHGCIGTNCLVEMKPGVATQQQALFDDRDIGAVHLQDRYVYPTPFNVRHDRFSLEFKLYQKQDSVSSITIKDIRLLDGTQEIAYLNADKTLDTAGQTAAVNLTIQPQPVAEDERSLTLRVWYAYTQNNETKQADFSRPLNKVVLLSPDV